MSRKKALSAGIGKAAARAALQTAPAVAATPSVAADAPSDGTLVLKLPASLTIRVAREYKAQIGAVTGTTRATVDGTEVGEIDTAGVQLLLALHREICAAGGQFEWRAPSALLVTAARSLGLSQELALSGAA